MTEEVEGRAIRADLVQRLVDGPRQRRTLGPEIAEYTPSPASGRPPDASSFVRFSVSIETIPPDEAQTIDEILASTRRLHGRTRAKFGEAVRVSHAKAHGAAVGELTVLDDLPAPLAQGAFTPGARYGVIARLANVPGELDRDSVATQRGLALKLLGVEGERLPGHTDATQDFVLDSGNRFAAGTAAKFLASHRMLEHAPQISGRVKAIISRARTCRELARLTPTLSNRPSRTSPATRVHNQRCGSSDARMSTPEPISRTPNARSSFLCPSRPLARATARGARSSARPSPMTNQPRPRATVRERVFMWIFS